MLALTRSLQQSSNTRHAPSHICHAPGLEARPSAELLSPTPWFSRSLANMASVLQVAAAAVAAALAAAGKAIGDYPAPSGLAAGRGARGGRRGLGEAAGGRSPGTDCPLRREARRRVPGTPQARWGLPPGPGRGAVNWR